MKVILKELSVILIIIISGIQMDHGQIINAKLNEFIDRRKTVEKYKHLIVAMDADLKQKFRIKCIEENQTMTEVLIELITEYLKKK